VEKWGVRKGRVEKITGLKGEYPVKVLLGGNGGRGGKIRLGKGEKTTKKIT